MPLPHMSLQSAGQLRNVSLESHLPSPHPCSKEHSPQSDAHAAQSSPTPASHFPSPHSAEGLQSPGHLTLSSSPVHRPSPHIPATEHEPQSNGQPLQFSPFSTLHIPLPHESDPFQKNAMRAAANMIAATAMQAVLERPLPSLCIHKIDSIFTT